MTGGELDETLTADPSASPAAAPTSDGLPVGSILLGRYEILRFIAAGAMGEVYEAKDRLVGTTVAVKAIKLALATSSHAIDRLLREVALARKVSHPNICRLHDVHEHAGRAFVSMELLAGESLADRIKRGPLSGHELDTIARQLVAALAALHAAGVVHRDFKSSNIMLVRGDDGVRAVVTDFGLARSTTPVGDARLTADATLLGTPAYMSPEQVEGREATPASDIYCLGVVLFEMATGALPFQEETALATATARLTRDPPRPREQRSDLAPGWEHAILRCLARAPDARPRRVEEVLTTVHRRRPWPPIAAGGAVIVLAAGAWFVFPRDTHPPRAPAVSPAGADTTCPSSAQRLRDAWDADVKARIGARYESHPKAFVRDTWRGHARQFDQLAAAWATRWDAACASADRTTEAMLYGQRLACLESNLVELRSYVNGLTDTSVDVEAFAAGSPGEFPIQPPSDCDVVAYLRGQVPPPPAAARAQIDLLMREFHQLRAKIRFAGNAGGAADPTKELARLEELRAELLALGYPAGAGEVGYWHSEFLSWFDRLDESARVLKEVVELAEGTRDDALLVKALYMETVLRARGDRVYDVNDGDARLQRAAELTARLGDPPFLLATVAEARVVHTGRHGEAAAYIAALDELARAEAQLGLPGFSRWRRIARANMIAAHGDTVGALAEATRILAEREAEDGQAGLYIGMDLLDLASVFAIAGDHERALAIAERAATILDAPALTRAWSGPWNAHRVALAAAFALGRRQVADQHVERAIAAGRERHGSPVGAYAALADALRIDGARDAAAHVLTLARRADGSDADRARLSEVAAALRAETSPVVSGDPIAAVERFRGALRELGPDVRWRAPKRSELNARYGIALLESGAAASAAAPLMDAIWVQELCCNGTSVLTQEARFALARALVEVGGDRERALALARLAHTRLAAMGPPLATKTAAIEAWLATQR